MNARDRIINAVRSKPTDHVPLYIRLWDMGAGIDNIPFNWRDQVTRAENFLSLGVDDTLLLQPPLGYTEEYDAGRSQQVERVRFKYLQPPHTAAEYKQLRKTYITPEGELTQVVKITADWPHGQDIMLFSDFNIPRYVEPLIKTIEDIPLLKHLLASPTSEQRLGFKQNAHALRHEAQRLGVALDGGWSALGDSAVWLCGMQNIMYWQMDQPEVLEALLDVLLEWELNRIDLLLEEGIDVMVHMAWYEGTDFWTPKNYRRLLRPRLQQIIDKVHARDVPLRYIITKGWRPLQRDLMEMGIDCLTGVDPVQDKLDLRQAKQEIGGQISLMGGINAAVTVSMRSEKEIRLAVDQAIEILSPRNGFILYPVDNIACEWPWEKVEIVIDQWKKHR
jgi:uroporphyrinogen-III decarboxylase